MHSENCSGMYSDLNLQVTARWLHCRCAGYCKVIAVCRCSSHCKVIAGVLVTNHTYRCRLHIDVASDLIRSDSLGSCTREQENTNHRDVCIVVFFVFEVFLAWNFSCLKFSSNGDWARGRGSANSSDLPMAFNSKWWLQHATTKRSCFINYFKGSDQNWSFLKSLYS